MTVFVSSHLRKSAELRKTLGYQEAVMFPGRLVATLESGNMLEPHEARKIIGYAWKYIAQGWSEQQLLEEAFLRCQRIEARVTTGMHKSTNLELKFFKVGEKVFHFSLHITFAESGNVASVGSSS